AQLRSLDDPFPGRPLDDFLCIGIQWQIIREPFLPRTQGSQSGRFEHPLLTLEDHELVELASRLTDSPDGRNEDDSAHGARIRRISGLSVFDQPLLEPGDPIPLQAIQVVADWVEFPLIGDRVSDDVVELQAGLEVEIRLDIKPDLVVDDALVLSLIAVILDILMVVELVVSESDIHLIEGNRYIRFVVWKDLPFVVVDEILAAEPAHNPVKNLLTLLTDGLDQLAATFDRFVRFEAVGGGFDGSRDVTY